MLNTIDEGIKAVRQGKIVIVVDDENRENEGDLLMAAEKVTGEAINFMTKYGRGLICMPVEENRLNKLKIEPMVDKNTDNQSETAQITVVDSKDSENDKIKEKATETSKQIEEQLTSKENMNKSTYVLDMKMTREKQRNSLTEQLNEIINNPSTADAAKVEASNIKVEMVKNSDTELKIENLLLAKGYDQAIVFIDSDKVNVVVNMEEITQNDATKIFDIVSNQSGINRENIKLTNNR